MSGFSFVTNKDLFLIKHSVNDFLSLAFNSSSKLKFSRSCSLEFEFTTGADLESDKVTFAHSTGVLSSLSFEYGTNCQVV